MTTRPLTEMTDPCTEPRLAVGFQHTFGAHPVDAKCLY
jgi:hypothetical protein